MSYWTTGQDAELARLWREGVTIEDIAFRLERSPEGVSKRARRIGMTPRLVRSTHKAHRAATPRVDDGLVRALRAEIPDEDLRDLTGRFFGDPNPADMRRQA